MVDIYRTKVSAVQLRTNTQLYWVRSWPDPAPSSGDRIKLIAYTVRDCSEASAVYIEALVADKTYDIVRGCWVLYVGILLEHENRLGHD